MTSTGNDCYFYYSGACYKGDSCTFRHQPAALGSDMTCDLWKQGICTRPICEFRHAILNKGNNNNVKCIWENQPSGCLKPNCTFFHTKPKPFPGNDFGQRPPFGGMPTDPQFRPPMMPADDFQRAQVPFHGPGLAPSLIGPDGVVGGNQVPISRTDGILGNPPHIAVGLLGPPPGGNQLLAPFMDGDKSFQEHVKLFKQILNRREKQETKKDKSKRRVIPKYGKSSTDKDFSDDKLARRPEKRENSRKKKSRDKSKKTGRKESSHKSKGKSDRKHKSNKRSKEGDQREFDGNQGFEDDQGISDFSESPKSNHSSDGDENLDFGVKSYEEILREKALRNLLEKKKMRQLNSDGSTDESSRLKIEEIERELEVFNKGKQTRYEKDVREEENKMLAEGVQEEKAEGKLEDEVGFEKEDEEGFEKKDADAGSVKEEGELDGSDLDAERSPVDVGPGSPVSSEISLQAEEENLSFGEDETGAKDDGHTSKIKGDTKNTGSLKSKAVVLDDKPEKKRKKGKKRVKSGKQKIMAGLKEAKEDNRVKVGVDELKEKEENLNKTFDLGIKSFDEIIKEKRQRSNKPEGGFVQRQLKSVLNREKNSLQQAKTVEPEKEVAKKFDKGDQDDRTDKKPRKLIRKVMVKGEGKAEKSNEDSALTGVSQAVKQITNITAPLILTGSPRKEAAKIGQMKESLPSNDSTKDPVVKITAKDIKDQPKLEVKSFEEIMREKRLRRQQNQTEETKDKNNDDPTKVTSANRSPVPDVKLKRTTLADEGARARRLVAATPLGRPAETVSMATAANNAERSRRLLLKRPSTKQKAAMVASGNMSLEQEKETNSKVENTLTTLSDTSNTPLVLISKSETTLNRQPVSNIVGSSTLQRTSTGVSSTLSSFDGNISTSFTNVTTSSHETSDSVVARVSPFLYTNADGPIVTTSDAGQVSSTGLSQPLTDVTFSENSGSVVATPQKIHKEKQRRDSTRKGAKRKSNEDLPVTNQDTFGTEEYQGAPSPTKRAKETPREEVSTASKTEDVSEAIDSDLEENEDLLSDEELEREIANLSPLSGEDYEDIDEDDLLMEVDAIINQ